MKVNCRKCDICEDELGARDMQYWLRKPIIKWGAPEIGMLRMDICDACLAKLSVMIQHPELIRNFGGDFDELAGEADGKAEAGESV